MELGPFGEAASFTAAEEFPNILRNPKVHYISDESSPHQSPTYVFFL
jgi:hypothetical protein